MIQTPPTHVILPAVSGTSYQFTNLSQEPQVIKARSNNNAYLYIDSDAMDPSVPANDVTVSSDWTQFAGVLISRVNRIGVKSVGIFNNLPNVNPTNNIIRWIEGVTEYSVEIPEGMYQTIPELFQKIASAMDGAGSGTVTYALDPFNKTLVNIINTVPFHFLSSSMMIYGKPLVNMPTNTTFKAVQQFGPVGLLYTKYIDYRSYELTENSKLNNNSNGPSGSPLIFRFYIQRLTCSRLSTDGASTVSAVGYNPGWMSVDDMHNVNWFSDADRLVNTFDITLWDQFGRKLYLPTNSDIPDTATNFTWNMTLVLEL